MTPVNDPCLLSASTLVKSPPQGFFCDSQDAAEVTLLDTQGCVTRSLAYGLVLGELAATEDYLAETTML